MKTFLLSLCLLLFANGIAQSPFNRAYHNISEKSNPFIIEINNSIYFTSLGNHFWNFGECYLYKHSPSGVLIFKSLVIGSRIAYCGFKTNDNKLFITGQNSACEGYIDKNFVTKIDTNGNAIFTSTYAANYLDRPVAALQYSDSSYYSFTDGLLVKHDKNGVFQSKTNLGLTNISAALLLPNGNILLSAKRNNTKSLVIIQASGSILDTVPFPILFTKFSFYGGQKIMGLGENGKLYKLSSTNALIASSSFSSGSIIKDFVCKNDTAYSILSTSTLWSNYMICDTSFNSILLASTTTNSLMQNAICLNSSQVAILSTGTHTDKCIYSGILESNNFSSLSMLNKASSNNFVSDIALISVTPDSMNSNCLGIPNQPGSFTCSSFLRPKIKIKNVGTSTISSFKLNCLDYHSVTCGAFYFQEIFSGLNLLPGNSLELTAVNFAKKFVAPVSTPVTVVDYCFFITVPNNETDKTFEDNDLCLSHSFPTSLNEESKNINRVTIKPNPFENSFFIESEVFVTKIDVYNVVGVLIESISVNNIQAEINTSILPAGVYFIKAETENGSHIRKVIKE